MWDANGGVGRPLTVPRESDCQVQLLSFSLEEIGLKLFGILV
jgi:hypothetical protein